MLPPVPPNPGTPQYWKLFHDAVRGPDVILGSISKMEQRNPIARATAKLALLREMNSAGVWLIDACVTALYRPGSPLSGWPLAKPIAKCSLRAGRLTSVRS